MIQKTQKNRTIPHKTPEFSDVIALAGNQRASGCISHKKPSKLCAKKSAHQKPAKLQVKIAIKRVLLEKQPRKTVFFIAVDTNS